MAENDNKQQVAKDIVLADYLERGKACPGLALEYTNELLGDLQGTVTHDVVIGSFNDLAVKVFIPVWADQAEVLEGLEQVLQVVRDRGKWEQFKREAAELAEEYGNPVCPDCGEDLCPF